MKAPPFESARSSVNSGSPSACDDRPAPDSLESSIHEWGEKILTIMDAAEPPSLFSARGFYGALMDWAMKDEQFKVQLFRFVDVLPTLASASEVSRHLTEYLDND